MFDQMLNSIRLWFQGLTLLNKTIITGERDLLGDPIIHRTSDEFGDILVIDRGVFRSLTFDSIYDQSSMDLRDPLNLVHEYTQAMVLALAFLKPRHITLLGLGGGSILRSVHNVFPECKINAIELRQQVHVVAAEYFGLPVSNNITITIADAERWLNSAEDNSTDVILADMFTAYCMNPFQMQKNFIQQSYRVLNKKGWIIINYHDISDLNSPFFEFLYSIFADVFIYKTAVGNNNVIFASKERVNALAQATSAVLALEKKLGNKSINFFNRLTRLTAINRGRYRK